MSSAVKSLHFLYIEDDIRDSNEMKKLFEMHEHSLVVVTNGEEALSVIKESPLPFDGILIDYLLECESGIDIAEAILKDHRGMAVLLISDKLDRKNILDMATEIEERKLNIPCLIPKDEMEVTIPNWFEILIDKKRRLARGIEC